MLSCTHLDTRLRHRPLVGLLVGRAAELRVVDRERGRVGQTDALNQQALQRRELGAELGGRHGRETRVCARPNARWSEGDRISSREI